MNSDTTTVPTRGERNNNPGNLDYLPGIPWQGQLGIEILTPEEAVAGEAPRFARFDTAQNGVRALVKQLLVYQTKHACRTLSEFVTRFAPDNENDTAAYAEDVAQWVGISPDAVMDMTDPTTAKKAAGAFIRQENGRCIYDAATIAAAVASALA